MAYVWEQMNEHLWKKKYIEDASARFIRNPEEYSKRPVAICARPGHCAGNSEEGGYCYYKLGCTAKRKLDGSGEMLESEAAMLAGAIASAEAKQK